MRKALDSLLLLKKQFGNIHLNAFTLAEVLITLGIIGVVAMMTIPSLVMTQQKQVTASRLKKAYSTFYQAVEMSKNDNGDPTNWDNPSLSDAAMINWWNKYIVPYLGTSQTCTGSQIADCWVARGSYLDGTSVPFSTIYPNAVLKDGTVFHVSGIDSSVNPTACLFIIDINGKQGPNTFGKDLFMAFFRFASNPIGSVEFLGSGRSDTILLNSDPYGCNKTAGSFKGYYCGRLIMLEGWQIKDDYPW